MKELLIPMFRLLISFAIIVLLFTNSCSTVRLGKLKPEYQGIDSRAQELYNEYIDLAKINKIQFIDPVTIGFKKINSGDTVGMCHYGAGFREIDLDIDFWNNTSPSERMVLIYHELTHCLCNRKHDYDDGKSYPPTELDRIKEALNWQSEGGEKPGRFDDGCPTSVMYPKVLSRDCILTHYQQYIVEMFNRCDPW